MSIAFIEELLQFGIYDILKSINTIEFPNQHWGNTFEKYLESRLNEYNVCHLRESDLKKRGCKKQVDFFIPYDNNIILIEAKGIESKKHTGFFPSNKIMFNAYEENIIKSLMQAHNVIASFKQGEGNIPRENVFLFVITYKDLYLGDPIEVWEEFIRDSIQRKYKINEEGFNLIPKNIFFMTIGEFDNLLSFTEGNVEKTIKAIKDIVQRRESGTVNFRFSEYLRDVFGNQGKSDPYLSREFEDYLNSLLGPATTVTT